MNLEYIKVRGKCLSTAVQAQHRYSNSVVKHNKKRLVKHWRYSRFVFRLILCLYPACRLAVPTRFGPIRWTGDRAAAATLLAAPSCGHYAPSPIETTHSTPVEWVVAAAATCLVTLARKHMVLPYHRTYKNDLHNIQPASTIRNCLNSTHYSKNSISIQLFFNYISIIFQLYFNYISIIF